MHEVIIGSNTKIIFNFFLFLTRIFFFKHFGGRLVNENNFPRIVKRFLNILMITKDFNNNMNLEIVLKY